MKIPIEFTFDFLGNEYDLSGWENIEFIFWSVFALTAALFFLVYNKFVQVAQIYVDKALSKIIKR